MKTRNTSEMVGWLAVLVFLTCTRMVSSEAGTADGVWIEVKKEEGNWLEWSEWSLCSTTCGPTSHRRQIRRCASSKFGGIQICPNVGNRTRLENCTAPPCTGLTSWVLGNCTQACGGGQLTKTRKCVDIDTNNTVVEPMHCGGVAMESLEECNTHRCTALTKWKTISDCSQPCGGGLIRNNRMCIEVDGYNTPSNYIRCEDAELEASFECNVHNCTDPMSVDEYAYQPVYNNFKELTSIETRSRVKCGADCLSFTQRHHCTAFLIDDSYVCHCGVLSPFVTGPPHVTNMYVKLLCRQSNITAIFGIETATSGSEGSGLPTRTIGMNGVTECAATSKIPSSDVIDGQSVIHLQKYVYAFGGKMVGQHLHGSDSVYKYSLEMDTWTQMSSLIQGRYAAAASILSENEIFIAGGYHGSIGPLSSTEIYNSETNTVVNGPGMLYDAYSLCAKRNKLTGQIYFVGGFGWENNNGNKFRTGTLVFDTVTRAFSILSGQLTVGRAGATCAVLENDELLIAAGGISDGWQGTSTVEILDLKTKTWSNAGVMPYTAGVWTAGEFLFLLGTELYQYELNSNQWLELVDVPFDFSKMRHHFVQVDASLGNFCPFA